MSSDLRNPSLRDVLPRGIAGNKAFFAFLVIACCAMPCPLFAGAARPSGDAAHSLTVGGRTRTYRVYVPHRTSLQAALPVVIALHGDQGSARTIERVSGFSEKADEAGFLAVYPNGTSWGHLPLRSWNAGTCCGYAMNARVDDVAFVEALLDDLTHRYPVDPRRVYVAGMSNGGMLAYRLACEVSDRIAAIAAVAGAMTFTPCTPIQPVAVLIVHGTEDAYVPYRGGRSALTGDERIDPSIEEATSFWARHNGCPRTPESARFGNVVQTRYAGCHDDTEVLRYTIEGGRHRWPGRHGHPEELPATDRIWEFFSRRATR
jgi:polyhydroxybutyrate depolymerase